jgi:ribosomal-protein-alanine N-acetyltransferase
MVTSDESFVPWRTAAPVFTRRLVLREPAFGDVSRIARYLTEPRVARMLASTPAPFSDAHASVLVGDLLASNHRGDALALAVARKKEPDSLIGLVSFSRHDSAAEIGWWFGPPYWGKGFASEAVTAMVKLAFRDPAILILKAGAFADNPASVRVQEKLGFWRVGVSSRHCLARQATVEHIDMALQRDQYLAQFA